MKDGIDVAIRIGDLPDSNLVSRGLTSAKVSAFASPAYLAARGTPGKPADLEHHNYANFRYQASGQLMRWVFKAGSRTTEFTPDAAIVVDVSDAVVEVIAAGGSIGMSASFIAAPYVERGLLVPVLTGFAAHMPTITAVWPESRRASPSVKAFIGFLEELFLSPAPWDAVIAESAAQHKHLPPARKRPATQPQKS